MRAGPPALLRSRRPDEETGNAATALVTESLPYHAQLDWLTGSSLMAWCGGLVPTTNRSMNLATRGSLRGLTLNGPLQKAVMT